MIYTAADIRNPAVAVELIDDACQSFGIALNSNERETTITVTDYDCNVVLEETFDASAPNPAKLAEFCVKVLRLCAPPSLHITLQIIALSMPVDLK